MISQDEFMEALKGLHFINAADLPELTFEQWIHFRDNPAAFFVYANPLHRSAIWREVERYLAKPGAFYQVKP